MNRLPALPRKQHQNIAIDVVVVSFIMYHQPISDLVQKKLKVHQELFCEPCHIASNPFA
jgi:hypothetical protein